MAIKPEPTNAPSDELRTLLMLAGADALDGPARGRLNDLLRRSAEARLRYARHCQLHALLTQSCGSIGRGEPGEPTETVEPVEPAEASPPPVRRAAGMRRWAAMAIAATLCCVMVGGYLLRNEPTREPQFNPGGPVVASLVRHAGAVFSRPSDNRGLGDEPYQTRARRYDLLSGLIELQYRSGARLIFCGPASFELVSESHVKMIGGRVSGYMTTPESLGFLVETPTALATDHGTEFSIDVGTGDNAIDEIHVFDGQVNVQPKSDEGTEPVELSIGRAMRFDHRTNTPAGIDVDNIRFIRRFDQPKTSYRSRILSLGPDVYLPMRIVGDGRVMPDLAAPIRRATLTSARPASTPWATGFDGGVSLRLDGPRSGTCATLSDYPKSGTNAITIIAWVYANARTRWGSIAKNWGDDVQGQFHFGLLGNEGRLQVHVGGTGSDISRGAAEPGLLPLHQWHHVAFVADAGTITLYRNGQIVATGRYKELPVGLNNHPLCIGAKLDDSGQRVSSDEPGYWDGCLDELAIFNHAIDAQTIADLHRTGREISQ